MTCPRCEGRGWQWQGEVDNAHREMCELCKGEGLGQMRWEPLITLMVSVLAWALACGVIWWSTTQCGVGCVRAYWLSLIG